MKMCRKINLYLLEYHVFLEESIASVNILQIKRTSGWK